MMFKKIGIVGFKNKSSDLACALNLIALWAKMHREVSFFAHENLKELAPTPIKIIKDSRLKTCDLLIAIGGDGTVLSASHLALGTRIPILGVNAGRVGFLAETRVEDLTQTLDNLYSENYSTRERMMVDAFVYRGKKCTAKQTVLNELHIRAHAPERMVNICVEYGKTALTEYWADSLLVSTPTGSTAYNLAAGGPIIHPATPAVVLTPVAPSSLSMRPLVLSISSKPLLIKSATETPVDLVFDGRNVSVLNPGEHIILKESDSVTTFIRMPHTGFVGALKEKLGWTGKPKNLK